MNDNSYYKKGCEMAKTIGLDISDRSKRAPGGPLGGIMLGTQRQHEAQVRNMTNPKINSKVQDMTADKLLKTASTFGLTPSDFGFDDTSSKGYQFNKTPQTISQIVDNSVNKLKSQYNSPQQQQQPQQPSQSQQQDYYSDYQPQQDYYSNYQSQYPSQQYPSDQYDNQSYDNYYGYNEGGRVYKSEGGEMAKDILVQQVLPTAAGLAGEAVAGPLGGVVGTVVASQLPSALSNPSDHDRNMSRFQSIFPKRASKLQALQNQHAREQEAQPYIEQAKDQYEFLNQVKNKDSQYESYIKQLQQQLQNSQQQYNQPSSSRQNNYLDYQSQDQQEDPYYQDYYSDYQY